MTEVAEARAELGLIQRRKLGLTLANVLQTAAKLKKDGKLSDDEDVATGQIAAAMALKNPSAYAEAALDWEKILAWIEKILPIILQLISIFGG